MAVVPEGKPARTHLMCLERFTQAGLLRADLETGRTHQVRLHCTWIGHPLMGDPSYGSKKVKSLGPLPPALDEAIAALPGQALHAGWLTLKHPRDDQELTFAAPPPPVFEHLLAVLRAGAEPAGDPVT
jgi:23S rRNA pseudouridine1911/1915/1917 synthase